VPVDPTLDLERSLIKQGATLVIGCDEVGRGAIAGPVAVGVAAATSAVLAEGLIPAGLRDSKLLSEKRREVIAPAAAGWLPHAVGTASSDEVVALGIVAALGLAGYRALGHLHRAGVSLIGGVVLLDGNHDWLTRALPAGSGVQVVTRVKADRDCAVVAAASVIAKVDRDGRMRDAHDRAPEYGWDRNKGYGSAGHAAALRVYGPHPLHRRSWLSGILSESDRVTSTQ